jgi:hypothetical protein
MSILTSRLKQTELNWCGEKKKNSAAPQVVGYVRGDDIGEQEDGASLADGQAEVGTESK